MRHDAEQERDALAAAAERLQQELSAAQQVAGSEALELRSAVATLQQRLDAEEQRCGMQQVGSAGGRPGRAGGAGTVWWDAISL